MEVVASPSQGRTAAAQCGLFTYKSVPVIFEPPCTFRFHKRHGSRGLRLIKNIVTLLVVFISASTLTPIFTCFAVIETPPHDSRYGWLMYLLVLTPLCAPTSLPSQFFYILL